MTKPDPAILAAQVEAALDVWFAPQWATMVQLAAIAPAGYGRLVADSRARMRQALIAARDFSARG